MSAVTSNAGDPTSGILQSGRVVWLLRIVWFTMTFTLGTALADAAADQSTALRIVVGGLTWVIWAAALGSALVQRPITLTAIRVLVPISVPAAIWVVTQADPGVLAVLGLLSAVIVTFAALSALTGDVFVDGASYGEERRMMLRVPGPLTPVVMLVWVIVVVGLLGGPILLATKAWAFGAVAFVVGVPAAYYGLRSLHSLARRWIVFVPAGMVLHDHLSLVTPVLFSRATIRTMSAAQEAGAAHDFTQGAFGLAVGVQLNEPLDVTVVEGRGGSRHVSIEAFICAPTRPGSVLAHAHNKRLV